MFWNKFPYTDFHELNLDWILSTVKSLKTEYESIKEKLTHLDEIEEYVQNYLDGLDWSGMAADAIQDLYDNGDLADLIAGYIASEITPTLDQLTADLASLTGRVDGLKNAESAFYRDSSSAAVHNLDFYYIDRTYDGGDSDGTMEKPFVSVDQAIEETFNKGIFAPNMRFLSGGNYECNYAVFNGVTWHLSGYTSPTRPVIHFKCHNNVTFYNSHTNFSGWDCIIDDANYIFRAENSEIHIGDNWSCNRRVQLASCGSHIANCDLESLAATNSTVFIEGANLFTPAVNNAMVFQYNCLVQINDDLTINDTTATDETKRAIMVTEHSSMFMNTTPLIGENYTIDLRLANSEFMTAPVVYASFTKKSLGGINTVRLASQVIES